MVFSSATPPISSVTLANLLNAKTQMKTWGREEWIHWPQRSAGAVSWSADFVKLNNGFPWDEGIKCPTVSTVHWPRSYNLRPTQEKVGKSNSGTGKQSSEDKESGRILRMLYWFNVAQFPIQILYLTSSLRSEGNCALLQASVRRPSHKKEALVEINLLSN